MIHRAYAYQFCLVSAAFLLASCSARFDAALNSDLSCAVETSAEIGPRTSVLAANLSGLSGPSAASSPVLDAASIVKSLKAAPGVASASFRNPSARALAGSLAVADLNKFLAGRFFRAERSPTGGRVYARLDRASAPAVLASLSPSLVDVLTALMAPAATGENLGAKEFLDAVASVYGEGAAAEIGAAKLRLSLELPGPVKSCRGGTFSGRKADFVVPAVDLLVLEKPLEFEAVWSQ